MFILRCCTIGLISSSYTVSGFSDVARNRPVSERHSWTEVGTKLLVHHFFAFLSPDRAGNWWPIVQFTYGSNCHSVQALAARIAVVNTLRNAGSFDVQSDNVNIPWHILSLRFFTFFNGWFTCQFFWQLRKKCWNYCIRLYEIFL